MTSVPSLYYSHDKQRMIFFLVTKPKYKQKPTYKSIENSLKDMRDLCKNFHVTELAIPKIGCGIGPLDWKLVSRIIRKFSHKVNSLFL